MPNGAFDERVDMAEMFTLGRATSFKIELPNGNTYPVLFETTQALERSVKRALERNSFLYPYPCHIILCHIDLDVMKFAVESLGRITYFSKLLPENSILSEKIDGYEPYPIITFADGS